MYGLKNEFFKRMNTLQRYIFRQVFFAALLAVGLFAFVLVAGNAMREVISLLASGQVSWGMFAQLLLLLVPYVGAYALPLGLLSGILIVMGRLSAQHEITAIRAAGVSLYSLVAPILLIALGGIVFSLFVNFYYSPVARTAYKENLANVLRHDPLQFIQPRTFIKDFPGLIIYVGSREGGELRDFRIWELDAQKRVTLYVKAESGSFAYDRERDAIVLTGKQAVAEKRSTRDPEDLQSMTLLTPTSREVQFRVPMAKIIGQETVHRKLSMLTLVELLDLRSAAKARAQAGDELAWHEQIRIQMQIQSHFANAFSVLSLALLAIPLGLKTSRSETYVNTALAFGLAMVYYVAVIVIGWTDKNPALRPDLLVWVPNCICQVLGLGLIVRANRR